MDTFLEIERAGDLVVDREIDIFFGETSFDFSEVREGDLDIDLRFSAATDFNCGGDLRTVKILLNCFGDLDNDFDLFLGLSWEAELELDADLERLTFAAFSIDFDRDLDFAFFSGLRDLDCANLCIKPVAKGGGDSVGDLSIAAASALVKGNAGEGDLLVGGDVAIPITFSDDEDLATGSCTGPMIIFCPCFGSSSGNAMSKTFSSFLSSFTFTGLITFFPSVSLALAARPVCSCFRVLISFCRSSSSCFGSSSTTSASSSLDDLKLTRGAMV